MWPWGHLAVAYLCYVGVVHLRGRREQPLAALVAVGVGSQVPDLVDKPLAWYVTVLPSGRSLGHSLLFATVVLAAAFALGRRRGRTEAALAFSVAYLSHVFVDLGPDVVGGLLAGDVSQLTWTTYLVWPLLPSPPYPNDTSFATHFASLTLDAYMLVQFALLGIAVLVWAATGMPGVTAFRRRLQRRFGRRVIGD
jgi:hypothetical protein